MISVILFDLDGTIIDSELVACQAILECAARWGVPIQRSDAATVAGKKWEVAFDLLYQKFSMPLSKEDASKEVIARYKEMMQKELRVVSGVVESIQDFAQHFRLGLVSGSHREDILWALNKLDVLKHFEVVLGAEDYPNSKPAPDGYLKALQLMNAKPEEALVFEDSEAGIASAIAAQIPVVAVFATNHFGHDLSKAHQEIRDFQGVTAAWIKTLKL